MSGAFVVLYVCSLKKIKRYIRKAASITFAFPFVRWEQMEA